MYVLQRCSVGDGITMVEITECSAGLGQTVTESSTGIIQD